MDTCGWRDLYWKLRRDNNLRMRAFRNLADMWHRGEDDIDPQYMAERKYIMPLNLCLQIKIML